MERVQLFSPFDLNIDAPQGWKILSQETGLPEITRHSTLIYLLVRLGPVNTEDIKRFSKELLKDTEAKIWRPLFEVCQSAELLNDHAQKRLFRDPVLNHIILHYYAEELKQVSEMQTLLTENRPLQKNEAPLPVVDILAGSGPSRPLLKDLYKLVSFSEVSVSTDNLGLKCFSAMTTGKCYSEALKEVFEYRSLPKNDFILAYIRGALRIQKL